MCSGRFLGYLFILSAVLWADCIDRQGSEKEELFSVSLNKPTMARVDLALLEKSPFRMEEKEPVDMDMEVQKLLEIVAQGNGHVLKEMPSFFCSEKQFHPEGLDFRFEKKGLKAVFKSELNQWQRVDSEKSLLPWSRIASAFWDSENHQVFYEIELEAWVLQGQMKDLDNDGRAEFYVQIEKELPEENWLKDKYFKEILSADAVLDEIRVRTSYWYPRYNTDLVDPQKKWPVNGSSSIREIKNPIAVIKGNPFGKVIEQAIEYRGFEWPDSLFVSKVSILDSAKKQSAFDPLASPSLKSFLQRSGEKSDLQSYQRWLQKQLGTAVIDTLGRPHLKRGLESNLAMNLASLKKGENPIPSLKRIKRICDSLEVNFLVVPIPTKGQVYSNGLPGIASGSFAHPEYAQFFADLIQKDSIDVLDVFPAMVKAKKGDKGLDHELYQKADTHLSARGFITVSNEIVRVIQGYDWYQTFAKRKEKLKLNSLTTPRKGDLVEYLTEQEQTLFPTVEIPSNQFLENGKAYKTKKGSPILLMGDSHTGVFEKTDAKSSGFASHIAFASQLDVDLINSWGGGPQVFERVWKYRKNEMAGPTRVLILIMSARDFWKYPQGWPED